MSWRFTDSTGRTTHLLDRNGFIRDWLATSAWISPANDLDRLLTASGDPFGPNGRWVLTNGPDIAPLKERIFAKRPFTTEQKMPVIIEGGAVNWCEPGTGRVQEGKWSRIHTGDDGYVDWSHFSYTPEYRNSLMATQIEVDQPEWRRLVIESQGPVQVWINGAIVLSTSKFGYMQPLTHEIETLLPSGVSNLVISQWQISLREVRHAVRARFEGLPVRIVIPSDGADEYASEIAERELSQVAIRSWARTNDLVEFSGPDGLRLRVKERMGLGDGVAIELKKGVAKLSISALRRAAQLEVRSKGGSVDGDVTATMLDTGEIFLEVRVDSPLAPVLRVFRTAQVPDKVRTKVTKVNSKIWRKEVLDHVAGSFASSARALARLENNPNYQVTNEDLAPALTMITSRADCADFEAVGLVHVLNRFPDGKWDKGLREKVIDALKNFKYWIDQPGLDAMCYFTENHQLVWHTAEHLIGEFLRKENFSNAGITGAEHSRHGAEMALAWLKLKLEGGFSEFDSNAYLAIDTLALVSLLEFSPNKEIRGYAEALLDRMLLSLASNSWRGIHGAAHGRSYTTTLRSSRFEETAPIMWALWGMGALNLAVLPVTTLITSKRYVLPALIVKVAHSLDMNWDARQFYRGKYRFTSDLLDRPYLSDLRIWRTSYGMLSSVQDYRAGLPGLQEHVWGITLSPEVQVFASYPASHSHATSVRPNAWAGHLVLPRVRQDKNRVFAIYPNRSELFPESTHLWFPTPMMDDYKQKGSWIIGRVGDAYVAVATSGGFSPKRFGDAAFQEWLPRGNGSLYVALMSDKKSAKSFKAFVASLKEPDFDENDLRIKFISKDRYEFSWDGSLTVNGKSDLLQDGLPEAPPRLVNPAVHLAGDSVILDAKLGGAKLKIDIESGRRLAPESRA
ncbi:MAG: hypothetical protein ACO3H0_03535 [Candidatus Planktophila sp.]